MWTTYSSPISRGRDVPEVLSKTAISTGDAALRSSPRRSISCAAFSGLPEILTVYRRW